MEDRATLMGVEYIDFTNDKNERVQFVKLHLMEPNTAEQIAGRKVGQRVQVLNTTRMSFSQAQDMVGCEVVMKYEHPFGSGRSRFVGLELA